MGSLLASQTLEARAGWHIFPVITFFLPENSNNSYDFNADGLTSLSKYLPISGIKKGSFRGTLKRKMIIYNPLRNLDRTAS